MKQLWVIAILCVMTVNVTPSSLPNKDASNFDKEVSDCRSRRPITNKAIIAALLGLPYVKERIQYPPVKPQSCLNIPANGHGKYRNPRR